ncbi:hypothetical protein FPOAC1_003887 [Fusarium poae]|uniref:uncharacterized protein n=1 Tax=Fusarium poae TaxID=36050 RepID=UPI001CEB1189|nr:uncharacterized protein FPOAC1_013460 [Fusarium poae]XP_044714358.1 hypothetical protein FPOAC1_003887 [Fusarium poae]KAG8664680.1 hypothetical protein FPOAC1_013460 [Fusarium poae]KAG8677859.1 hypothetical protein FPOAC1_003887 [Fusarium poae]
MGGFDGSYVSDAEDGSRDRDSQGEVGEAVGTVDWTDIHIYADVLNVLVDVHGGLMPDGSWGVTK